MRIRPIVRGRFRPSLLLAVGLAMLLPNSPARAAGAAGPLTIQSVDVVWQNFAIIYFTTPAGNPDSCSNGGAVAVNSSDPLYSQQMSVILTAAAAGKKVTFWLSGCVPDPWGQTIASVYSVTATFQ